MTTTTTQIQNAQTEAETALPSRQVITKQVLDHCLNMINSAQAAANLCDAPFTHCSFDQTFPDNLYRCLVEALPAYEHYLHSVSSKHIRTNGSKSISVASTFSLSDRSLKKLSPHQETVLGGAADALRSAEFKQALFSLLEKPLCKRLGISANALRKIGAYPHPHLVRNLATYQHAPYAGTSKKLITIQFHLPTDETQVGLGTTLYKRRLLQLRNIIAPAKRFVPAKRIAFAPNTGFTFVQNRNAFQGQESLPQNCQPRNALVMFYLVDPSVAKEDSDTLPVIV